MAHITRTSDYKAVQRIRIESLDDLRDLYIKEENRIGDGFYHGLIVKWVNSASLPITPMLQIEVYDEWRE